MNKGWHNITNEECSTNIHMAIWLRACHVTRQLACSDNIPRARIVDASNKDCYMGHVTLSIESFIQLTSTLLEYQLIVAIM